MERSATTRTIALEAVAEPDVGPVEHKCNHFSIREYVALLQKKNPELYSLSQIFCKQQKQDEHHNLCLAMMPEFRVWNCPGCLDKVKIGDGITSPSERNINDGCSISFVGNVRPTSVGYTRLFPYTQPSPQGNQAGGLCFPRCTLECNSKCNSLGSKGALTEMNVDPAIKESHDAPSHLDGVENISNDVSIDDSVLPNIPQIISTTTENGTKELQGSARNLDVMTDISNDVPTDDSPEDRQMISCSKKKKNESKRKRKRTRLLSELIETDQIGGPANCIDDFDHAGVDDIHESDEGKMSLEMEKNNYTPVNATQDGAKSENRVAKKKTLHADHKGQMTSENTQRRSLSKVSLRKCDTHSVSGTHDQKMSSMNKKKQRVQMLEKQTETDDIPMDVVEVLVRLHHDRQLMTNADSLETSHTQLKKTAEDCAQLASKDGSLDASTGLVIKDICQTNRNPADFTTVSDKNEYMINI